MSLIFLLRVLYLIVPAAIANMMPVFVKKINFINYPIDFKVNFTGKRLLGDNKTFRGLFFGIIGSIIIVFIQKYLFSYEIFRNISLIDYSEINFILFGFLGGFGVLFGDLIGSFIKRRLDIAPGKSLFMIDQINGGFGFVLLTGLFYLRSWSLIFWILLIWTVGHFALKYVGYLFNIYKEKI